jgi:hypothetical protein
MTVRHSTTTARCLQPPPSTHTTRDSNFMCITAMHSGYYSFRLTYMHLCHSCSLVTQSLNKSALLFSPCRGAPPLPPHPPPHPASPRQRLPANPPGVQRGRLPVSSDDMRRLVFEPVLAPILENVKEMLTTRRRTGGSGADILVLAGVCLWGGGGEGCSGTCAGYALGWSGAGILVLVGGCWCVCVCGGGGVSLCWHPNGTCERDAHNTAAHRREWGRHTGAGRCALVVVSVCLGGGVRNTQDNMHLAGCSPAYAAVCGFLCVLTCGLSIHIFIYILYCVSVCATGGFGSSPYLQRRLTDECGSLLKNAPLRPNNTGRAVVLGEWPGWRAGGVRTNRL